jgi:hypothetical protein
VVSAAGLPSSISQKWGEIMVGKVIRSLACCAVALALVSSDRAVAAPFTWNGGTTGTWTSAANWLPSTTWSGSTNNADTATFLTGDATTVTIPNNQIFLNALTVNRDLTINGTSSTFSTGTAYTQAANTSVTIGLTNASALFRMGHASSQAFNTLGGNASLTVNVSATTTGQSVVTLGANSLLTYAAPINFGAGNSIYAGSGTVAYAAASGTSGGLKFYLNDTTNLLIKSTASAATGTAQAPLIAASGTNTVTLERNLDLMTPVTSGTAGSVVLGFSRSSVNPTNSVSANAAVTVTGPSTLSMNLLGINTGIAGIQKLVVDNGAVVQVGDFSAGKAQGVSMVNTSLAYFQNMASSGTFQVDSVSGGTLRVNADSSFNAATAASGSLSLGLGLAVTGSATLVNNGVWTNRNYQTTTIMQGLSVAQAATLSGTGSFNMTSGNVGQTVGKSVAINGTVAPGDVVAGVNGVGTLTINSGTVSFGAASRVAISGSNATLDRLVLNAPVSVTNGAVVDFAATSNLTQGRYQVLTGSSGVNTFTASNAPAAYSFGTSGTDAYLWAKPVFGTITATPAAAQVITGGTVAFGYTVANAAPAGGQDLVFTSAAGSGVVGTVSGSTTVAPGAASGSLSGLSYVGSTPGLAQAATFTVSDPNAFATSATGTVALDVLAHATPGFATAAGASILDPFATGTISLDFGSLAVSAGLQTLTYSLTNLASQTYGSSLTAGLALTGFTADGDGFESGLATFASLAAGNTSSIFQAEFTPTSEGSFSRSYTLTFFDDQSVAGSTQQRSLTVNMQAVVVPVPEPGALALAGVGVVLAGWRLSRRRPCGRSCSTRP